MLRTMAFRTLSMSLTKNGGGLLPVSSTLPPLICNISTTPATPMPYEYKREPKSWPRYNSKVFPPQEVHEEPRPAYVCHMKSQIKYSPDKMWWVACLVRGMTADEAVKQLSYVRRKGAGYVKQAILEAQELAVQQHNVEFKSNLWVAESMVGKGFVLKGLRRHARRRFGIVEYKHCHYFVRLEEGPPPKDYYLPPVDGPSLLQRWLQERRDMRIWGTL